MVANLCFSMLFESSIRLSLDHLLEIIRINCTDDVDEELPRRPLLLLEVIVEVLLDVRVALHLLN